MTDLLDGSTVPWDFISGSREPLRPQTIRDFTTAASQAAQTTQRTSSSIRDALARATRRSS